MIKANGAEIHYQWIDNQQEDTIVFSNSLGTNLTMWKKQIEDFSQEYNILLSDTRGHGKSEVTSGEYNVELLGNDVLALTKELGIEQFHFCGLSMGGLIGQWLAINGGERVQKIIQCNTAVKIGNKQAWNERIKTVKKNGLESIANATPKKWFTDSFLDKKKEEVEIIVNYFLKNSPEGYAANCAMVRDANFTKNIEQTNKKVLIIAGSQDPVTTVSHAQFLVENIKHAKLHIIEAKHLSAFEKPKEFNQATLNFLTEKDKY